MNWAAMNYVKRLKRESGINGNLRFVMMMIASRIPKGRIETVPTSDGFLARTTGNTDRTIQNLREQLVSKGAVAIGDKGRGRGRFYTYKIQALAGPLFMLDGEGKPESLTAPKPESLSGFNGPGKPESLTGFTPENRKDLRRVVRTGTSEDVRTIKTTTAKSAGSSGVAVICDEALAYLNWLPAVYSEHCRGAQLTIDYEKDGPRVSKLLSGPPRRSLQRIQAMTVVMFTVTELEDKFLADAPDRGIRLLGFAADRYDRISIARETRVAATQRPCLYKHDPPCSSTAACVERERELLAGGGEAAFG